MSADASGWRCSARFAGESSPVYHAWCRRNRLGQSHLRVAPARAICTDPSTPSRAGMAVAGARISALAESRVRARRAAASDVWACAEASQAASTARRSAKPSCRSSPAPACPAAADGWPYVRPVDDLHAAVEMLDHCRAAFHPVAGVDVVDAVRMSSIAAWWMWPQITPSTSERRASSVSTSLERADEVHRLLDLAPWPRTRTTSRAGPSMRRTRATSRLAKMAEFVGPVAEIGEPARIASPPCRTGRRG